MMACGRRVNRSVESGRGQREADSCDIIGAVPTMKLAQTSALRRQTHEAL